MIKRTIITSIFSAIVLLSFGQKNDWKEYFSNKDISVYFKYSECHYPDKGLHQENVLLRLVNSTERDVKVSYKLSKVYNGKEVTGDTSDFKFTIPAYYAMESSCDDLKPGLNIFSKILDLPAKSILNSFELKNLTINGQIIAR